MVGSYEESILRGRMSTTPSRPLDFVAQIGVLGKGKCRASLKCPPHVTLPFPAVFYSYNSGNGRISDDQPSPYVGMIDIEHSLPPYEENDGELRRRRRYATPPNDIEGTRGPLDILASATTEGHSRALRIKRDNLKRRSQSPKAPPGGCYRIPQQGQLQIVLKNPNKTAVKLFLVPYDLSDMEPGQKTFIRQRSYSAGPIIDMPLSSRKNFGTERPEAALSYSEDPRERPTLRYLVHIHICCPAKGRYFLYKHIRVVFANRVPDGKEKLRNEVQLPDPKYSTYKPSRESASGHPSSLNHQSSIVGAMTMSEKKERRKGNPLFLETDHLDAIDGLQGGAPLPALSFNSLYTTPARVRPIPFRLEGLETLVSRPASWDKMEMDGRPLLTGQLPKDSNELPESPAEKQSADAIEADHAVPEIDEWDRDSWRRA